MENSIVNIADDNLTDEYTLATVGLKVVHIDAEALRKSTALLYRRFQITRQDIKGYWFLELRLWKILDDKSTLWQVVAISPTCEGEVMLPMVEMDESQLNHGVGDWLYDILDIVSNTLDAARERGEV